MSIPTSSSLSSIPTKPLGPYALNVELQLHPHRITEFLNIIKYDQQQTLLHEPNAIQFTIGQNIHSNNIYHLHEQYQTQDDFLYHTTTLHYQKWQEFCNTEPFMKEPIVQFYQCQYERQVEQQIQQPKQQTTTYCLNVEIHINEHVRDEFLHVIHNNLYGSRYQEALCIQYDYGECCTTKNIFYFHEEYIGNDNGYQGFQLHQQSLHFLKWEEFVNTSNQPFVKDPIVHFFQSI